MSQGNISNSSCISVIMPGNFKVVCIQHVYNYVFHFNSVHINKALLFMRISCESSFGGSTVFLRAKTLHCTVEPLNKGQVGKRSFVLYREVSFTIYLECPLLEVPLYSSMGWFMLDKMLDKIFFLQFVDTLPHGGGGSEHTRLFIFPTQ